MSGWCSSGYWIEMMTALHVRMIEYHRRESVRTEVFFSAPPRITRTKGKDQFLGKISFNQIHLHVLWSNPDWLSSSYKTGLRTVIVFSEISRIASRIQISPWRVACRENVCKLESGLTKWLLILREPEKDEKVWLAIDISFKKEPKVEIKYSQGCATCIKYHIKNSRLCVVDGEICWWAGPKNDINTDRCNTYIKSSLGDNA